MTSIADTATLFHASHNRDKQEDHMTTNTSPLRDESQLTDERIKELAYGAIAPWITIRPGSDLSRFARAIEAEVLALRSQRDWGVNMGRIEAEAGFPDQSIGPAHGPQSTAPSDTQSPVEAGMQRSTRLTDGDKA